VEAKYSPEECHKFMNDNGDYWVFAYGSLMWNLGFSYEQVMPARLFGYHRAFCVLSWAFRGQRVCPGLVLGLDNGGSCVGRAFRIVDARREQIIQYLDDREIPDIGKSGVRLDVYRREKKRVHLLAADGRSRHVRAACYICEHAHVQYAGKLSPGTQLRYILQGEDSCGTNVDYLRNTILHMDDLGISDGPLHRLWAEVQARPFNPDVHA
jgi:cation transport protein ChaC